MPESTDHLIARLVADARPVKHLRPPSLRAALWLVVVGALFALAIWRFSDLPLFMLRAQSARLDGEMVGMLLTGVLAVIAAFHLSLPERSPFWALLPLPTLALWLSLTGYGCFRHWFTDGWALGSSWNCLRFVLGVSVPLCASILYLLHRATPLSPVRVTMMGALGVASVAAFTLQFFHPLDVTFVDLGTQFVSVMLVILIAGGYERMRPRQPYAKSQ